MLGVRVKIATKEVGTPAVTAGTAAEKVGKMSSIKYYSEADNDP